MGSSARGWTQQKLNDAIKKHPEKPAKTVLGEIINPMVLKEYPRLDYPGTAEKITGMFLQAYNEDVLKKMILNRDLLEMRMNMAYQELRISILEERVEKMEQPRGTTTFPHLGGIMARTRVEFNTALSNIISAWIERTSTPEWITINTKLQSLDQTTLSQEQELLQAKKEAAKYINEFIHDWKKRFNQINRSYLIQNKTISRFYYWINTYEEATSDGANKVKPYAKWGILFNLQLYDDALREARNLYNDAVEEGKGNPALWDDQEYVSKFFDPPEGWAGDVEPWRARAAWKKAVMTPGENTPNFYKMNDTRFISGIPNPYILEM